MYVAHFLGCLDLNFKLDFLKHASLKKIFERLIGKNEKSVKHPWQEDSGICKQY